MIFTPEYPGILMSVVQFNSLTGKGPEILCSENADNYEEVSEKSEKDYEKEDCSLKRK